MNDTYKMTIAGCERELPLCPINDKVSIGAFIIFGDVEVTIASAKALIEKCPEFDYILTPETKSIPLAYEMSRQSGKPYIVCRKKEKLYMRDPVSVSVKSITTASVQTLVFDKSDADKITGQRVLIVDDVISTGASLTAIEKLIEGLDTTVVAKAAILAEGDAADRDDIVFLEKLPLFTK